MTAPASCSSCGRHIIWATSPNGARLPLDARPVTVYRLIEDTDPPDAVKIATTITQHASILDGKGEQVEVKAYVSHFLTCPSAAQHSRRP